MKSYRKELWFHINRRRDFVNITGTLQNCVEEAVLRRAAFVNAIHITASVFINDMNRTSPDFEEWLETLALRSHIRVTGITAMKVMRMLT